MDKSLMEVAQDTLQGLYDIGLVDKVTMREFEALGISFVKKLTPQEIKALRIREKISQPVFARALNVSASAVKHWEIGDTQPSGAALKLLNLVSKKGLAAIAA